MCKASDYYQAEGEGVEEHMVKIGGRERRIHVAGIGDQPWVGAYHRVHAALHDTTDMTQAKTLPEGSAAQKLQESCPGKIACRHRWER